MIRARLLVSDFGASLLAAETAPTSISIADRCRDEALAVSDR